MIISVPHSGTRSLREYLGQEGYWHFGQNDPDIKVFEGHADIPIRNPIDVAISWDARYPTVGTKTIENMIRRFDFMLSFIYAHKDLKLWKVEDLPLLESSKGPEHKVRETKESPRIDAIKKWMAEHQDFYGRYY